MDWFTSDHHFGHRNILKFANRPWFDVHEMDVDLINNWNSVVKENDTVYYLGDFALTGRDNIQNILDQLNGNIKFIPGNHDKRITLDLIAKSGAEIKPLVFEYTNYVKGNKLPIVLCHYPMRSWNRSFHGSYHFFGHTHGNAEPHYTSIDIGVDSVSRHLPGGSSVKENYRPVTAQEAINFINEWRNKNVGKCEIEI